MVFDFDDFGCNHVISDMCQSHDCRDQLDKLHYANQDFRVTLFTIPGEMTMELANWCESNKGWVEVAVHGFYHKSNYECEKIDYNQFSINMGLVEAQFPGLFVKGFKAPGWQISDDAYRWLLDNDWWVADQAYNNDRRPKELKAYVNDNGVFMVDGKPPAVEAWHGHTWDCVGNGIYETYDHVERLVKGADEFKFVSEVLN